LTYAQIAVNVPQVSGVFDYHIPDELAGQVEQGCLVVVPFGAKTVQGIVVRLAEQAQVPETRPVLAVLDRQPALTPHQIRLGTYLADENLSPLAAYLHLMLPPGLSQQADTVYRLSQTQPDAAARFSPLQRRLVQTLEQRGELRGRQIQVAFPRQNWKAALQALQRQGRVDARPVLLPPSVHPKLVRTVQLAVLPEVATGQLGGLGRGKSLERRQAVLKFLMQEPWPVAVSWVYASTGANLSDLTALAGQGLVRLSESEVWRDPLEHFEPQPSEPPQLTGEQQAAVEAICAALQNAGAEGPQPPFLLHGVTGSGKTEVYLHAVTQALRQGKQAIILVPEIALTPQTVRRFIARFPGQVGIIHSQLSPGERYDTWRRARAGLLPVIVGPRSALFTPLPQLGLIVIDEFHDSAYYQESETPFYHAVRAAVHYAQLSGAVTVLGSATPPVEWILHAGKHHWPLLKLATRVPARQGPATTALPLPPVQVVDMRTELRQGNRSIFSRALEQGLTQVLAEHQQAILFLNRVGTATHVFCRQCGTVLRCPRCDLPLTFHQGQAALVCHTCGYHRNMPQRCPACGSATIRQYGTGTERVENELRLRFPEARVLRWDSETTQVKGAHDLILSHFVNQRADILVGTQMLAKGLDLPLVTLVGVVLADVGLSFPDYRAAERTFQVLMQVAGRAGRSPLGGQVVLQTFQPEHYAIQAAAHHDYAGFYRQELEYRRALGYPPFFRLVRLEYRHLQADQAENAAQHMAGQVRQWIEAGEHTATELIGPVPCFFSRVNGYYRWQIVLRGPDPVKILRNRSLGEWRVQVDPPNLL
jgi:primosomal protein N' (replication factor Y)